MSSHHKFHRVRLTAKSVVLASLLASTACSFDSTQPQSGQVGSENVGRTSSDLLATACATDPKTGNVTLTVMSGEVAYVGYQSSTVAATNAVTPTGEACTVPAGKTINVNGQGGTVSNPEKLILDNSNGNLDAWPMVVTLDTAPGVVSSVAIQAPTGGSNMAIGASGIILDAASARAATFPTTPDVKLTWSNAKVPGSVIFNGGPGVDRFVADVAGLTASPLSYFSSWATSATLTKAVGAAYPGAVTASGGPGNDVLAGGAGANSLLGGAGDDVFAEGSVSHAESMSGGDGFDTVDYSIRTASQPVSLTLNVDGMISSAYIASGGSTNPSYAKGDVLTLVPTSTAGVGPATLTVTSVSSGVITGASITSAGTGWAPSTTPYATTGGSSAAHDAQFFVLMNGVATVSVVSGGTGYAVGDTLNLTHTGTGKDAVATVSAVKTGAITGLTLSVPGGGEDPNSGFSATSNQAFTTASAGMGAVVAVTTLGSADDGVANEGDSVGGNSFTGVSDVENIIGGAGNDVLDARSITMNDVALQGNAGNDKLRGGSGRDDLCGGPGNDILYWSPSFAGSGGNSNTPMGDFFSGAGGVGGGAGTSDQDTVNYTTVGAAVTACLLPAGCTSQNGAAGENEVINDTNFQACPGSRPFVIAQNGSLANYTPGMTAASKSIASITNVPSVDGNSYSPGDLISISGGGGGHAIVKVRDVWPLGYTAPASASNSSSAGSPGPASVAFSGTPTYQLGADTITITCTVSGTIGTAAFHVTESHGANSWNYTSSDTGGGNYAVLLGTTGLTATFSAGTYDSTGPDTYTETTITTGHGFHGVKHGDLIQVGAGYTAGTLATTAITGSGTGATFAALVASTGDYASYDQVAVGGLMTADIVAMTGDATRPNTLSCGTATACTLVGGTAADSLTGSSAADAIFGNGGGDTIHTSGGVDLVDLTNTGSASTFQIDCGSNISTPTIMYNSGSSVHMLDAQNSVYDLTSASACTATSHCLCQDASFLAE
jgi:hypothetical protein